MVIAVADGPATCAVRAPRLTKLSFEMDDPGRKDPSGTYHSRTITVRIKAQQRVIQTIRVPDYESYAVGPHVLDLDHDGRIELMIPTNTGGTGGEQLDVWHETAPGATFVRAGHLFGFVDRIKTTPEGFFAMYTHSSAASGGYTIFRFMGDTLVALLGLPTQVYRINGTVAPVGPDIPEPTIRNRNTLCSLSTPSSAEAQALRDVGLDPATAVSHFCRQAWVGETYG